MSAIRAGWLYSGPFRSEQSQGWYVPVMDKDGTLKLVDTYVIKSCYSEHDKNVSAMTAAILEMGTEPHPYVFSRVLGNYYYGSQCIYHVGDELPEYFEEVCYLPDWEYVSDRDAEDYEPCDVIWYVQLHFEHGYRWHGYRHGVCLKRKGAMKSFDRQLDASIADAHRSMTYPSAGYAVSAAIRLHEEGTRKASPSIEAKYHRMLEINDLLKRQQEEMRMLLEKQNKEGEDA